MNFDKYNLIHSRKVVYLGGDPRKQLSGSLVSKAGTEKENANTDVYVLVFVL